MSTADPPQPITSLVKHFGRHIGTAVRDARAPVRALALTTFAIASAVLRADAPPTTDNDRLIHHFDFDERDEGNLERVPKFWRRMIADGFPRYADGSFDFDLGHDAPPAFRLRAEGKNVAFRYTGHEVPTNEANDYRIVGWVRTRSLAHARAALSAYYLDHDGLPIADTQRFSRLVGNAPQDHPWQKLEIFLPAGPEDAKWIGITAWVVHPEVWDRRPRARRAIERKDVGAEVAFDDIRIYRLPRVTLRTSSPANVFSPDHDATLTVEVTDADTKGLTAHLDIFDVDGRRLSTTSVPVQNHMSSEPMVIDLQGMANGLATARVRVDTPAGVLAERTLRFASLQSALHPASTGASAARGFGIELDVADRADPAVELTLLRTLNVGAVKIPIWSGSADVPDFMESDQNADAMLYQLLQARVDVTGVFAGPPSELVRSAGAYPRPLLAMLADDPVVWRDHLTRVFAPYASIFRSWQIGRDADPAVIGNPNLPRAIRQVRAEIEKLITAPSLSVPASLSIEPEEPPLPADGLSYTLDPAIVPSAVRSYVDDFRARGRPVKTVYIETPDAGGVDRRSHLRDWCKRLIQTHHAGVNSVIVPQPWHSRMVSNVRVTEPDEEFVPLHTLTQLIGDAQPGNPIYIAPGVTALSFNGPSGTVVALWDDRAELREDGSPGTREHDIQLGDADRQIDLWGRTTPLARLDDGRQRVHVGADPVFIDGVDRWLIEFRTMLELTPRFLELSVDAHRQQLAIVNPHDEPLGVDLRVVPPDGWEINPRQFKFSLAPGERAVKNFDVRVGRDALAEARIITLEFQLDATRTYKLLVPIELQAGVRDLDAWGLAVAAGDRLIVRHRVFNRSNVTLNLRGFTVVPGRPRQTRFLTGFLPGQTTTLEYHFKNYRSLIGRKIRLHLRELTGPRIHNIEIDVR